MSLKPQVSLRLTFDLQTAPSLLIPVEDSQFDKTPVILCCTATGSFSTATLCIVILTFVIKSKKTNAVHWRRGVGLGGRLIGYTCQE